MIDDGKHHATIVLERNYDAAPSGVFEEFANPVARAQWSAPSGDELIYDEANFTVGGRDVFRCGPKGDPKFRGETIYHVIAPGKCFISSELIEASGQRRSVALNTLELEDVPGTTQLKLTIQLRLWQAQTSLRDLNPATKAHWKGSLNTSPISLE